MQLKDVYITGTNCVTPLGFTAGENADAIQQGKTGITLQEGSSLMEQPFYAAIIDDILLEEAFSKISTGMQYTRLEKMMLLALHPIIKDSGIVPDEKTALIISTTKGNITSLKEENGINNAYLHKLGDTIAAFYGFTTQPVIVSNACVSGILAVSVAKRLLQSGLYNDAFIVAADEVSEFVLSGFNSFQAMSANPCRPYSANRDGVTIGEAAAAAHITVNSTNAKAKILGDASVNDANHISGPSRTGEGLVRSVANAIEEAGIAPEHIGYISAHGTATPYNDEMEAIAFNRLGLGGVPVNSFKGYYGHTLGASGLLETVMGLESVEQGVLYPSAGFDEPGVSQPLNIITKNTPVEVRYFLKTASGFGGCNTAVVFENRANGRSN